MSAPASAPISQHAADTLHLMAGDPRKEQEYAAFLAACWEVAQAHEGRVLVNDVRLLMSNEYGLTIHPRQYSAFWCRASSSTGPLRKTGDWAVCDDPHRKNTGRPQPVRRWVGPPPEALASPSPAG